MAVDPHQTNIGYGGSTGRVFDRLPFFLLSIGMGMGSLLGITHPSLALPPPEDVPEEILRTEIIVDARSPLDGKLLTAAEYAELQEQIRESQFPPELNSEIQDLIFLLNIRKLINDLTPFFDPL